MRHKRSDKKERTDNDTFDDTRDQQDRGRKSGCDKRARGGETGAEVGRTRARSFRLGRIDPRRAQPLRARRRCRKVVRCRGRTGEVLTGAGQLRRRGAGVGGLRSSGQSCGVLGVTEIGRIGTRCGAGTRRFWAGWLDEVRAEAVDRSILGSVRHITPPFGRARPGL